jgi:hypothetical protein
MTDGGSVQSKRELYQLCTATGTRKILFIIFVDRIFTTLFERLFTNVFDVIGANSSDCLRVAAAHHRLTPSQPKFDNNKKDRIARMY